MSGNGIVWLRLSRDRTVCTRPDLILWASLGPAAQWAERLRPYVDRIYRRCADADVGFTRWLDDPARQRIQG